MGKAATRAEINDFLKRFKAKVDEQGQLPLVPRRENLSTLAMLGISRSDVKTTVLAFTETDYRFGPGADHNGTPGEIWEFELTTTEGIFTSNLSWMKQLQSVSPFTRQLSTSEKVSNFKMRDNKKYICDNCGLVEESMTRVVERSETYNVKGESIPVLAKVRVCESCNEDISDELLDDVTLQTAYDVYRSKHKIVFPAEIRALRETYGLSQRGLGTLLGWGPITIHRYESGSLPDESHNQVLRLMQDPFNVARIFLENKETLDTATYQKMLARLNTVLSEKTPGKVAEVLTQRSYLTHGPTAGKASLYTGFISFQPEILMEMMMFFASKAGGVLKTKLNKLLWYADFVHYKHHTLSISGATYTHLQYGPVPQNYESFLSALYSTDALTIEERDLGTNKEGEPMVGLWLSANGAPKLNDISATGVSVLEAVQLYFQNIGSKRISDLSHEEEGYIATKHREAISYAYADVLKVDPIAKARRVARIKATGIKPSKLSTQQMASLKGSLSRSRKR